MTYALMKAAPCTAGYYCGPKTDGLTAATSKVICSKGKMCPSKSMQEVACEPGFYQDELGKSTCKACDAGFYCPFLYDVTGVTGNTQKTNCPAGYECVSGSLDQPVACAPGKYKAAESTLSTDVCLNCPEGFYCPLEATVTPIACPDLFWCPLGSSKPTRCLDGYICRSATPAT